MVEQQRRRIEQEMTNVITELDKDFLRKFQGNMHRCAALCCDDMNLSTEGVHKCVTNCEGPFQSAQNYVQQEIQTFQNRLQRCVQDCNDDIRLKMGANPSDTEIQKYTNLFEQCATKCVDKNVSSIPTMLKAMRTVLGKQQKEKL